MSPTRTPKVVEVAASDTPQDVAAKVASKAKPVLVVLGEFDPVLAAQVQSLCVRTVLPITSDADSVVLDNGAKTGCSAALGETMIEQDTPPVLVGVSTSADEYDPNHTFLIRNPEQGTDGQQWMFQLASAIARSDKPEPKPKPVVLMIVGGGADEKLAIVRAARRGWPIVLITGASGVSDDILAASQAAAATPPTPILDPVLREIVETAALYDFKINGDIDDLTRILSAQLHRSSEGLDSAWNWYDDLDKAAICIQDSFSNMQNWLLILSVIATLLAIAWKVSLPWGYLGPEVTAFAVKYGPAYRLLLKWVVILVPITISVLTAMNNRFRAGNKWILFRAAAEAIKREIFRYRAQAGVYSDEQCKQSSRDSKLASKVKDITESLFKGEVNKTNVVRKEKQPAEREDKQLAGRSSFLTADDYITQRVQDQINYFLKKTRKLDRRLRFMHTAILIFGAVGTFLAAIGVPIWVALTTTVATVLTTKLEIDQVENSLVQYNVALTSLRNVASWWSSLSPWERSRRRNIDVLVDQSEKILEGEMAGWVQQMQSTLEKLTEREDKRGDTQAKSAAA